MRSLKVQFAPCKNAVLWCVKTRKCKKIQFVTFFKIRKNWRCFLLLKTRKMRILELRCAALSRLLHFTSVGREQPIEDVSARKEVRANRTYRLRTFWTWRCEWKLRSIRWRRGPSMNRPSRAPTVAARRRPGRQLGCSTGNASRISPSSVGEYRRMLKNSALQTRVEYEVVEHSDHSARRCIGHTRHTNIYNSSVRPSVPQIISIRRSFHPTQRTQRMERKGRNELT